MYQKRSTFNIFQYIYLHYTCFILPLIKCKTICIQGVSVTVFIPLDDYRY